MVKSESSAPVMVEINGRQFATQLYGKVQRFVAEPAVETMVQLSLSNFNARRCFREQIPDALLFHRNPVVRFMAEQNQIDYFGLNELALAYHERLNRNPSHSVDGSFTVDDIIEFDALQGWSVSGFYDSITSTLSNLGFGDMYEEDGDEYEDFSEVFSMHNPLWDE